MSGQTELPHPNTKLTMEEYAALAEEVQQLTSQIESKSRILQAADKSFSRLDLALYAIREEDLRVVNPGESCTTRTEMPFAIIGWRRGIKERIHNRKLNPRGNSSVVIRGLEILSNVGGLNNLLREKPAICK